MGKGFKSGAGGANPLNFKVVGGLTEPANPKENMIWVNTNQKITLWAFAVEEPTNPAEGMVWIKTNDSVGIEIDLLKKNIASIHLVSAKQYISGAWVDKEVKVWQNGEWRNSFLWVFNYGEPGYPWTTLGMKQYDGSGMASVAPTKTVNADGSVTFKQNGSNISCGIAYISTQFDLTDFKTLEFVGKSVSTYANSDGFCGMMVWSAIGSYVSSNLLASFSGTFEGTRTMDISAINQKVYIGVGACNKDAYVTVRTIRLLV